MEGRSSASQLITLIKSQAYLESNNIMEAAKFLAYIILKLPEPSAEQSEAISIIKEALYTREFDAFTQETLSVLEKALASVEDVGVQEALAYFGKFVERKDTFQKKNRKELATFSKQFMSVQPRPLDNKSGSLVLLPDEERMKFSKDWQAKIKILSTLFEDITLPITNLKEFLANLKEKLEEMMSEDIEAVRRVITDEGELLEVDLESKLGTLKGAYAYHLMVDVSVNPDYLLRWSENGKLEIIRALNNDSTFQDDIDTQFWRRLKEGLALRISTFAALKKFRNLLGVKIADNLYVEAANEIEVSKLTAYLNIILREKEAEYQLLIQRVLHSLCDRISARTSENRLVGKELIDYIQALKEAARTDTNLVKNKKTCIDFASLIKKAIKENTRAEKKEKKEKKYSQKLERKVKKAHEKEQAVKERLHKKEIKTVVLNRAKQEEQEAKEKQVTDEVLSSPRCRSVKIEKGGQRVKSPKERKTSLGFFQSGNSNRDLKHEVNKEEKHQRLKILNRFAKFHDKKATTESYDDSIIRKSPRSAAEGGSHIQGKVPSSPRYIAPRPATPRGGNPRLAYKKAAETSFALSDTGISYAPRKGSKG